ncbi:MAG: hypothetical protein JST04_07815 [Bdellovibrionales bacterium]|nr:hypothetical protein [Bdellovibrionales bacterium]
MTGDYKDILKNANPDPVLKLIARTAVGRELLERFLPLLKRGQVRIDAYPAAIVAKLREVIPAGQPIGACLVTEGAKGTIFLDYTSPIGVLAPFLVHEIAHALEPKVWAGQTAKSQTALLDAESEAFQTQFRFTQELRERDPAYDEFLKTNYPKAKLLHSLLEFDDIEELYGRRSA